MSHCEKFILDAKEEARPMDRCPNCEKPVSYGKPRTDEIRVEVEEEGTVTLHGTLYLTCGKCGRDLKSAKLEAEMDAYHEFPLPKVWDYEVLLHLGRPPDEYLSFETVGDVKVRVTGRNQATDRPGRPTRNSKYFGVKATVRVSRYVGSPDGIGFETHEKNISIAAEEQESSFEEC